MSYRTICVCDSCGDRIIDEEKYRTSVTHTCRKCQMDKWGFVVGEVEIDELLEPNKEGK